MTEIRVFRRWSLLLISLLFVVLVSSLFVGVFVNSSSVASLENAVHVKNEDELKNAILNASVGGSTIIILDNDITPINYGPIIPANKIITLTSNKATGYYKLMSSITVENGGVLKLDGLIIRPAIKSGNTSGVFVYGGGQFFMYSGEISGHTYYGSSDPIYAGYGGGVYNGGVFEMYGGKISGNTADGGGGVYNKGTFKMFGGEISGNKAITGGGVYNTFSTSFELSGGVISGNTANDEGGGVYNAYSSSVVWSGGEIFGNTAKRGDNIYPDESGNGGGSSNGNNNGGGSSNGNNNGGGSSNGNSGGFSLRDVVFVCVGVALVVVGVAVAVLLFTVKKDLKHTKEKAEFSPAVQQA
jgi:hypothetical protein